MDTTKITASRLDFTELASFSFKALVKSIFPITKLVVLFFIFFLAAVISCLIIMGVAPLWVTVTSANILWVLLLFLFYIFYFVSIKIYADLISSGSVSVLGAVEDIIKALPRIISAVLLFVGVIFLLVNVPLTIFRTPIIVVPYSILLLILMVAVFPYLTFFAFALVLRGAGPLECFKYSYYMVKGNWLDVFLKKLLAYIVISLIFGLLTVGGAGLFYIANMGVLKEALSMGAFGLIMFIGSSIVPLVLLVLFLLCLFLLSSFMWVSFLTTMFLNMEIQESKKKEEYPVIDPNSTAEDSYEFTEIFKNIKEVDVSVDSSTERIASPIAPMNREEALRQFHNGEDSTLPPGLAPSGQPVPERKTVVRVDNYPTGARSSMPTLDITTRLTGLGSLPSIYKKSGGKNAD